MPIVNVNSVKGVKRVKSHSTYPLIQVGLAIRLLRHVPLGAPVKYITRHSEMLLEQLKEMDFRVSVSGLEPLGKIVKKLDDDTADAKISDDDRAELLEEMGHVERIVFAESGVKRVYTFPERRFNHEYLEESPEKIFRTGVYGKLTDIAKSDIDAACRCLLFGEATATAFHILRATEDVLKSYYFHHKKQKRLSKPMWGPMTVELRGKRRNRPPDVVLDSLDLVRRSYRNPTQHPDAVYDLESAQDLVGVCVDLINKMADEL